VDRLVYIINICPPLAVPALQLAAQHIFKTRDVDLYRNTASAYDVVAANAQLPPAAEVAPLDQAWYDEWTSKNLAERTRLEVELKTYTSNMIKESIRVRSPPLEDRHPLMMHIVLDGSPRPWSILPIRRGLHQCSQTLHKDPGIVYNQSTRCRYVHCNLGG
jgi:hypothetical protein